MKTKFISSLIYIGALIAPAKADYLEAKFVKPSGSTDISAVSRYGIVALGSGPVSLIAKDTAERTSGDRNFYPTKVNDAGSVVGVNFASNVTDNDFAFYTPLGANSQLLLSSPSIVSVSLNANNKSVVVEKNKVSFFNAPVGTAAPVFSSAVNAGTNQTFSDSGDNLLLETGELIVAVTDLGSPRFAKVTPTGTITLFSQTVLPATASLYQQYVDGKILIYRDGSPAIADLINEPVSLFTKPTQVAADKNGTAIFAGSLEQTKTSGFPLVLEAYLGRQDRAAKIECFIPKKRGITDFDLYFLTQDGSMIGKSWGRRQSGDLTFLTPTSEPMVSFCPQVSIKIIGECKNKIKSTNGISFSGSVKKGTRCKAEISINDQSGKPLSGKLVVSNDGKVRRGVTDKNGKLRFKFLVNDSTYIDLQAPYGDKKLYSQGLSISASN